MQNDLNREFMLDCAQYLVRIFASPMINACVDYLGRLSSKVEVQKQKYKQMKWSESRVKCRALREGGSERGVEEGRGKVESIIIRRDYTGDN